MIRWTLTSVLIISFLCANGQATEKQLRDSLSFATDYKTKINLLLKLSKKVGTHSSDTALQLAMKAIAIAQQSENEKDIARSYRAVGRVFYNQGKYSAAIENFKNAFVHSQNVHDSTLLSAELDDIGKSYRRIGEPKQALEYLQQGLDIASVNHDNDRIRGIYNNMAMVLNDTGDDSLALKYYQKYLSMAETAKDTSDIILALNNIGFQYFRLKDLKKEEEYYLKALELTEKTKDIRMYGITYDNIGSMWKDRGNDQKAFVYFLKAYEYEKKTGVKVYVAEELKSLTEISIKMKNYQMALKYAMEEFKISEEIQSAELKATAAKNLAAVFEKLRQFEQSLYYFKIATTISDSLNSIEKAKTIANLASRYELTKKDSEISSLNLESETQKSEIQLQNKIRYGLIGFSTLVTVLLGVAVYQYRARQKANDLLTERSQQVAEQNDQLNNLNKVKDKILSSISHDVKGPLNTIQGVLGLMSMKALSQEEFHKLSIQLSARVNTTTSLIENLLHWSRYQIATAKANPVKTNIQKLTNDCFDLYANNAAVKNIALKNKIDHTPEVFADEEMIKIILRNLISNAIKFTKPDGEVKVEAAPHESGLCVSVSDTGVGIPEEDLAHLFSYEAKSTQGTAQEKGTGLGLILCKEFIEKNGGEIWADSMHGEGATFRFTVPLA